MVFNNGQTPILSGGSKLYRFNTGGIDMSEFAWQQANRPVYDNPGYGLRDWASDAWSSFYQSVQQGEMNEEQDKMTVAKQNEQDLQQLLEYKKTYDILNGYDKQNTYEGFPDEKGEDGKTDRQKTNEGYEGALTRLQRNGVLSLDKKFVDQTEVERLLQENQDNYNTAEKNYLHNLDQYNDSKNKADVSQYFTKRSNDDVNFWGNFFYKMPATMGTSMTSPIMQLTSTLGMIAGMKGGAALATGILAMIPGIGQLGAAVLTGATMFVGGAIGGQLSGGYQSRANESHMEAFTGLSDAVRNQCLKSGVDIQKTFDSFRQQLTQKGIDTSNMDDNMVLQAAISTKGITSPDLKFNDAVGSLYHDTRIIYDKNNALGAGEIMSDFLNVVPVGKFLKPIAKITGLEAAWKLSKKGIQGTLGHTAGNRIFGLLGKRFNMGADIARMGTVARNRARLEQAVEFLTARGLQALEEGTEEGAQQLIQYEFQNGEYSDLIAHGDSWSTVTSGDVFKYNFENLGKRLNTLGIITGLNGHYKDDQAMYESVISGMLLPFTDPRTMVRSGIDIANAHYQNKLSRIVGDYISNNLEKRDEISRATQLLDILDKETLGADFLSKVPIVGRFVNNSGRDNYLQTLDRLQIMMKDHDKDGKLSVGKANLRAITEDGSIPTDQEIDEYFDTQRWAFDDLWGSRKKLSKGLESAGIPEEDKNTYIALRHQASSLYRDAERQFKTSSETADKKKRTILEDSSDDALFKVFRAKAKANGLDLDDASAETVSEIFDLLQAYQDARKTEEQAQYMLATAQSLLQNGTLGEDGVTAATHTLEIANKLRKKVKERLDTYIDGVVEKENAEEGVRIEPAILRSTYEDFFENAPDIDTEFADNAQFRSLQNSLKSREAAAAEAMHYKQELKEFDSFSNVAKNRLSQYKDSLVKEQQLAQQQIDDIQTKSDSQIDPAVKTVTDLTTEEVEKKKESTNETINAKVTELNELLESVPQDDANAVYDLIIKPLLRGKGLINKDPISFARFVSQTMRNLKSQYNAKLNEKDMSEAERELLKKLKNIAETLGDKTDLLSELAIEEKARAKRHGLTLATDSQKYQDEDGNEYTLQNKKAQYSENEGVVLTLRKTNKAAQKESDDRLAKLKEIQKDLEDRLNERQNQLKAAEEGGDKKKIANAKRAVKRAQNKLDAHNKAIAAEEEVRSNLDEEVVLTSKQLQSMNLSRTDNKGQKHELNSKLKLYDSKAKNLIATNKTSRNLRAAKLNSEGDVIDENSGKDNYQDQVSLKEDDRAVARPVAYPLNTPYGERQRTKLTNPYYKESYWSGHMTMPYADPETIREYIKDGSTDRRVAAAKAFHRLGKQFLYLKEHGKQEEIDAILSKIVDLFDNKVPSIKVGNTTMSREDLHGMVRSLPIITVLYQPRSGKRSTVLHVGDFDSQTKFNKITPAEKAERIDTIMALLLSYDKPKTKQKEGEVFQEEEGVSEERVVETSTNRVSISQGGVHVYFNGFDYNIVSERDSSDSIFQTAEGEPMTEEQLRNHFYEAAHRAAAKAATHHNRIEKALIDLGFSEELVNDLQSNIEVGDRTISKLEYLIEGILKFGDGAISAHRTLIPNYVKKTIGPFKARATEKDRLQIAKKLLDIVSEIAPEEFLSYGDAQTKYGNTPNIAESVEFNVNAGTFWGEDAVHVLKNGEELPRNIGEENKKTITRMFEHFEDVLTKAHDADEFLRILEAEGYTFQQAKNSNRAREIITDYFNNRRFNRLATPTNFAQALSLGKSAPLNDAVDYENIHKISRHENSKISNVSPLGLIKDKDGKYYYSLAKWGEQNLKADSEDTAKSQEEVESDAIKQRYKELKQAVTDVKDVNQLSTLLDTWHEDSLFGSALLTDDEYGSFFKNDGDSDVLVSTNVNELKKQLTNLLANKESAEQSEHSEKFAETKEKEVAAEDDLLKGKTTAPFTFATGSFRDKNGKSAIIWYDANGEKHTMNEANGTPGAMYLIIPSYLNPQGRKVPVKLNVRHFSDEEARILAEFMMIAKDHMDEYLPEGGVKTTSGAITSTGTYRDVINSLIYTGSEALENNPTANNFERLLTIEGGQVVYGVDEHVTEEDDLEGLVNFIKTKKTFRVDRAKAANPNATFGFDLKITTSDGVDILDRKKDQNYIAATIDDGVLTTDLNHKRLFGKPSVRVTINKKWSCNGDIAEAKAVADSASRAKEKLDTAEDASREEIVEHIKNASEEDETPSEEKSSGGKKTFKDSKELLDFVKKEQSKIIAKIEETMSSGKYFLCAYDFDQKRVVTKNKKAVEISAGENGNEFVFVNGEKDSNKFLNSLTAKVANGKNYRWVLVDEDGQIVKRDDGKLAMFGRSYKEFEYSEGKSSSKSKKSSKEDKEDDEEVRLTKQGLTEIIATAVSTAIKSVMGVTPSTATEGVESSESAESETPTAKKATTGRKKLEPLPEVKATTPTADVNLSEDAKTELSNLEISVEQVLNGTEDFLLALEEQLTPEVYDELVALKTGEDTATPETAGTEKLLELPDEDNSLEADALTFAVAEAKKKAGLTSSTSSPAGKSTETYSKKTAPAKPSTLAPGMVDELRMPTLEELKAAVKKYNIKIDKSKEDKVQNLLTKYFLAVYGDSRAVEIANFLWDQKMAGFKLMGISALIDDMLAAYTGQAIEFFDERVQKEDYDVALRRTERILGKGFNLQIDSTTPKVWDASRKAQIFVFGQCTAAGIRLFRDANNRVARGSMYHEAFHKVSLFLLDSKSRQQMYDEARAKYSELKDATNNEVEEFLADKFADYVLDENSIKTKGGIIKRAFQKIVDTLRRLINRMTSANITPKYRNMEKLFNDMYAGRYAYAKATKNNIEEFNKAYVGNTAYKGFIVNGKEVAQNAIQYQRIIRRIIAQFVNSAKIPQTNTGFTQTSLDDVYKQLQKSYETAQTYYAIFRAKESALGPKAKALLAALTAEQKIEKVTQAFQMCEIYKTMLSDENWPVYRKQVERILTKEFNLEKPSSDPNRNFVDTAEPINTDDMPETDQALVDVHGWSPLRDSYQRNLYNEMDANTRLVLWGIAQESAKFNSDGLLDYVNPKQLYRDIIQACQGAVNVEDLINKLGEAAVNKQHQGDTSLMSVYKILTDEKTSDAFKNRFFTDFARYTHKFENIVYEEKEHDDGSITYTANVKNSTTETISANLRSNVNSDIQAHFEQNASGLNTVAAIKVWKSAVAKMCKSISTGELTDGKIAEFLDDLNSYFGINRLTGDRNKDIQMLKQFLSKNRKAFDVLNSLALRLNASDFIPAKSGAEMGTPPYVAKLKAFLGIGTELRNAPIATLLQGLKEYMPITPKAASQRGPENTKIYTDGSYNFVTRMVDSVMKTKDWLNRILKNPYAKHSRWVKQIEAQGNSKRFGFNTKLATVLNDDFNEAISDIRTTRVENILNTFTECLQGKINIPSLANKKFAGHITGLEQFNGVVDAAGNFNPDVIEAFTGYLADEILAVCDTLYARKNFIDSLNNILGTDYTIESFSALNSVAQENLFNSNPEAAQLLRGLVNVYHYNPKYNQVVISDSGHIAMRSFHIDLTKSMGAQFRHFKNLGKQIAKDVNLNELAEVVSADMFSDSDRSAAINAAEEVAAKYVDQLKTILKRNIAITINTLIDNKIISGDRFDTISGAGNVEMLMNKCLPVNTITTKFGVSGVDAKTLYRAIAFFTVQNMSDMVEFEKTVHGDIAYHKDITSVNKRYSGIVSTMDITAEKGCLRSTWEEDTLYDSPTYTTLTLNTSTVVATNKYEGDLRVALGIVPMEKDEKGKYKYTTDGKHIKPALNSKLLLDEKGELKQEVKDSALGSRFVNLRNQGVSKFLNADKSPVSDARLAEMLVADADNRFSGYLEINESDAQTYISARMYRQLRQRRGDWTVIDEARYNLLEAWEELPTMYSQSSTKALVDEALRILNVYTPKFEKELKAFKTALKKNNAKGIEHWKGYILGITEGLDATSLKYVYYGEDEGRCDSLITPIYDKMSLAPLFSIFTHGHEMNNLRELMEDREIDFVKFESAVKSGGIPSFEAYDAEGNFNSKSLAVAPVQTQYFVRLGKQLNTDPHKDTETALLTQFMKIALENVSDDEQLTVGGKNMSGAELLSAYKQVLDELTQRGAKKFKEDYGFVEKNGKMVLDRKQFMEKLKDMMSTQDLPMATLDALELDEDGNFKVHPSALPQIRAIQSRIISEMGKTIINTAISGQPLYQMSGFGYDNIFSLEKHADKHLYMPGEIDEKGNTVKRMQVRLSINFFSDIIKQAKQAARKGELKGYDFDNFIDQKRFILENKDLIGISYRVPTQGQDSTIPIEIVDILPTQQGGVIQFPSGVTAQTGSDFDIDKMYVVRYNYQIEDGKLKKLGYSMNGIGNSKNRLSQSDKELQNMLLDMYQAVLTGKNHYVAVNTPLDVCTAPVKNTIQQSSTSGRHTYEGVDGYYLNPMFQTAQKIKNAGSDKGIAPMALNSVFRFFIQCAKLKMNVPDTMRKIGLDNFVRIFDVNGEDITDTTSALINAFVDAVKDNYIGDGNVNDYTFDVTSLLTSLGFGNGMFSFLMQPIIKNAADYYAAYKLGKIGVDPESAKGTNYLEYAKEDFPTNKHVEIAPQYLTVEFLKEQMEHPTPEIQRAYLDFFVELKEFAQDYRQALTVAQVDTKKYGISADELIAFQQKVNAFTSDWNISFMNPKALFDDTFLGQKYEDGVKGLFDALNDTIFEFTDKYRSIIDQLCLQTGRYGMYNEDFVKTVGPKVKAAFMNQFFNEYLFNRFASAKPLATLTFGEQSVPARYKAISQKCRDNNIGVDFFNNVTCNYTDKLNIPQFMTVTAAVKEDFAVKNNVQNAMLELFESDDPEIRQWAQDFAVYMYYITAGSDANAGGAVKTTVYDILPPTALANLKFDDGEKSMTLNQFVEDYMMNPAFNPDSILDLVQRLAAISNDDFYPTLNARSKKNWFTKVLADDSAIIVNKSSKTVNTGGMQYGGMWTPYIKVRDKSGKLVTYKLISAAKIDLTSKTGKKYSSLKPVYGKTQSLGYTVTRQRNKSVRADGYYDENGNLNSMLMANTKDQVNDYYSLEAKLAEQKKGLPKNVTKLFPVENGRFDFSQLVDENGVIDWIDDTKISSYLLADKCDSVAYINGQTISPLQKQTMKWAQIGGKQVHKVFENEGTKLQDGETVALVGDLFSPAVEELVKAHPNVKFIIARNVDSLTFDNLPTNLVHLPNVTMLEAGTLAETAGEKSNKNGALFKTVNKYNRKEVAEDKHTLYVFTDNTDHTSKKGVPNSHGTDRNPTTAVIRGLDNAAGISTMKYFYKEHGMKKTEDARWSDKDAEEFEKVITEETNAIVEKFKNGDYSNVVLPDGGDGFFNSAIADISKKRTPKLYDILKNKVDAMVTALEKEAEGKKVKEHCKS